MTTTPLTPIRNAAALLPDAAHRLVGFDLRGLPAVTARRDAGQPGAVG